VIRLLLAHRVALSRRALAEVLNKEDDLRVVAEVASGPEILSAAAREHPAVVVVMDRPLAGGLDLSDVCARLHETEPACGVLVVTDPATVSRTDAALTRLVPRVGFIGMEASPAHLIASVRRMVRGEAVIDVDLAVAVLTSRSNPLTDREREILALAAAGVPVKEIAKQVHLSVGTVRNYLSRIVAKTGARTRIEAIRFAQKAGWV